jgi:hypothetical protein
MLRPLATAWGDRALTAAWAKGLWWRLPIHRPPAIPLAVCAIFKDEAPYLAEWVTFHQMMGVREFYLYDNGSTDDWRRELLPELRSGTVQVTDWAAPSGDAQLSAYRDCLDHRRGRARWMAFIDIDEFLFSPTGKTLPAVLSSYERHPAVIVRWHVYGPSGLKEPPQGLVTETFRLRAPDDHLLSAYGKPVVDPRRTISHVTTPHLFMHYDARKPWRFDHPVDEAGRIFSGPSITPTEVLRINHYYVKSESEALAKWRRGPVMDVPQPPLAQLVDDRLNDVSDEGIIPFVAGLRRLLDARRRRLEGGP